MIKILEVNNIDLPGKIFNGYDMIEDLSDDNMDIKQLVMIKESDNDKVIKLFNDPRLDNMYYKLMEYEELLSTMNVYSITTPALFRTQEYKEADIIHFHMFHNTRLSLYSLVKIAREKKVVLTLHDPFFVTGHCVHFYECNKWKKGCNKCNHLDYLFPFKKDNTEEMWKLKKYVFNNSNIDIVVSSQWMYDLVKESPIFENIKNVHLIPFGIDVNKFGNVTYMEARKHYNIDKDEVVLFLRAQSEFKGTEYIVEALKLLKTDKKVTVIACDNTGMLDEIKDKYNVIDLGKIGYDEMAYAMNACDIFLMPSKGESFGFMAVEAMSCSKPVVVFDNTALPAVTHTPDCGYLVKDKDAKDLMKAIKYLLDNPKERVKRGKLGRDICVKEYDYNVYNSRMKEMYLNVFKEKNVNKDLKINKNYTDENVLNIFNKIKSNEVIEDVPFIEYSNPEVQEYIMKMNEELYSSFFDDSIKISNKDKLKIWVRKHPKVYAILKKVLRK